MFHIGFNGYYPGIKTLKVLHQLEIPWLKHYTNILIEEPNTHLYLRVRYFKTCIQRCVEKKFFTANRHSLATILNWRFAYILNTSLYQVVSRRSNITVYKGRIDGDIWKPAQSKTLLPYILTKTVSGLGFRGTVLYLQPDIGLRYIIHKQVGVYGTWENFKEYYDKNIVQLQKKVKKKRLNNATVLKEAAIQLFGEAKNVDKFVPVDKNKKHETQNDENEMCYSKQQFYRVVMNHRNHGTLWSLFDAVSLQHEIDLLPMDVENTCLYLPSASGTESTTLCIDDTFNITLPNIPGVLLLNMKCGALPKALWEKFSLPPGIIFEFL